MLVGSDSIAHAIGFAIELALVLLREMAVVLRHVALLVILKALFTSFEARGLSGPELSVLYAVSDALLLPSFTAVDLVDTRVSGIDLACTSAGRVGVLSNGRPERNQATHRKNDKRLLEFILHRFCSPSEVNPHAGV